MMMAAESNQMAQEIRNVIKRSKEELVKNRMMRMSLIEEIRTFKENIKRGEALCSKLEVGEIDCSYVRQDLKHKRGMLAQLRESLFGEELNYAIERSRCRILHEHLDKMKVPFDPAMVRQDNKMQQK